MTSLIGRLVLVQYVDTRFWYKLVRYKLGSHINPDKQAR